MGGVKLQDAFENLLAELRKQTELLQEIRDRAQVVPKDPRTTRTEKRGTGSK